MSEQSVQLAREAQEGLLKQIRDKATSPLDSEQLLMVAQAYAAVRANHVPPERSGRATMI